MIISTLARELSISPSQVSATVELLDQGNTVPFIARYRKEVTGGLDDSTLRTLADRLVYLRELEDRKQAILEAIEEQGKLTEKLKQEITECDTKARLEDLYLPYKKRRKTKADAAREAGLEPLVDQLITFADFEASPNDLATSFVTEGYDDTAAVLDGARAILVDRLTTDADLLGVVREKVWADSEMASAVVAGKEAEGQTYQDYFDFRQSLNSLPSHRVLALLRGEREGYITLTIDPGEDEEYMELIANAIDDNSDSDVRHKLGDISTRGEGIRQWLWKAIRWGWRTKLQVSAGLDARMQLKERAELTAVDVFARNLKDVLLAAPAGQKATIGLDPGYRNGVKVAVVDETGKVVDTTIVYPHQPQNRWDAAKEELALLCARHGVVLMAIGNGTASRETEKLGREIAELVKSSGGQAPVPVVVSESGASVYSASELASKEFPTMDVSLRGAVSIARRLQDPLAELVKVDPKSIGVGQYQHDVNQNSLAHALDAVVEDAVNAVGVDLNTASVPLLNRVSGITPSIAENIVAFREENGPFSTRSALTKVPRLGPKAFEQCAGFLRITGGSQPLDASAVHPESYAIVSEMATATSMPVEKLIGNSAVLAQINPSDFATETHGVPTITDIVAELDKPGRDPRPEFTTATFKEGVEKISDLKPGMVLEGTVTNVAAFGAFVDVGVHQDGLVHVSNMSHSFVSDPHEVVKSGQVVKVKVMEVDVDRKRIGLSLRLDDDPENPRSQQRGNSSARPRSGGSDSRSAKKTPPRGSKHTGSSQRRSAQSASGSMADALRQAGFGR